jgi:putative membrane protein
MLGKTLSFIAAGSCLIVGLTGSAFANAAPPAMTDAQVLAVYIQVNSFDVETALLGRAQASSSAVRDLAAQVASDHMGVRQAAFGLAAACKVSPVLPGSRDAAAQDHARTLSKLATLKGAEFDKAYMEHEVAFHRSAIDAVKQVLQPSSTCPALKAHFREILPALEHHLTVTEGVARALTDH